MSIASSKSKPAKRAKVDAAALPSAASAPPATAPKPKNKQKSGPPAIPEPMTELAAPRILPATPETCELFVNSICYSFTVLDSRPDRDVLSIEMAFSLCIDVLVSPNPDTKSDPGSLPSPTWIPAVRLRGVVNLSLTDQRQPSPPALTAGGVSDLPILFGPEMSEKLRKMVWIMDTIRGLQSGYGHEIRHVQEVLRTCIADLRMIVGEEIAPVLDRFQGMTFETLEEKREICCETNALLDDLGLRVVCPKTNQPARLLARTGKGAPAGQFQMEVKGYKTCTSSSKTFPRIRLTLAPRDLRYERGKIKPAPILKSKAKPRLKQP